jgi:hypothetical protein
MKPKNKFQKQVFEASIKLPPVTEVQKTWAYQHCFEHIGRRTKKGIITCLECGVAWESKQILMEGICGCTCPDCKRDLIIRDTLKSVFRDYRYFCIVTVCEGFQVLRFFYIKACFKAGQKGHYEMNEAVQRWIAPDGKHATIARARSMTYSFDAWSFSSFLEIRPEKNVHNINPDRIYPRQKLIPELKRSGYGGECHGITPFDLFYTLLTDSRAETLLKKGETKLLKYFTDRGLQLINNYWASVKICMRNGYRMDDASIWRDYIDLLRFFGKDLHNAKYACPADLKKEHDRYMRKKGEWQKRQDAEIAKKKALEDASRFIEMKSLFFGVTFTDGLIQVKVLESVEEVVREGEAMRHCVYTNSYHLKPDSLILSAFIGDRRIETVELSLSQLKVLQSRGVCNSNTEYHDRIIKLVIENIHLIQKRLAA